jgi:oxazoline/thiazoline synthase
MLNQPKLKHFFHAESVGKEGVFLLSERGSFQIREPLYQLLTPLINGRDTPDEIVEKALQHLVSKEASAEDVIYAGAEAYHALMRMEEEGYIVESDDDQLLSSLAAFCETLNVDTKEANRRLQATTVEIKTFGPIAASEFISMLISLNIQVVSEGGDIEVILTDDYLQEGLDVLNQKAVQRSRPWMLVKPMGTIVWIGPIFHPGKTGCWECLAQRLRANRPIEEFVHRRRDVSTALPIPLVSLPSTTQTALGMAATEVFKWIVWGENKRLEGRLVTHDTLSLKTQDHILVRRPQCPSCGELVSGYDRKPLSIILGSRKKTFTADGGHRCFSPEETLRKYRYHISPITGIVRELEKVGSSDLTHTYVAKHHFASMFDDLDALRQNLTGRSAGKGKTNEQAKASAFCEAIERYSGVFQGNEIRQKGSYQLMGDIALHPNACMNFSLEQYKNREEWNARCPSFSQRVPAPFDEEKEIEWTPVWSLTHQEFKYLPTAYCYHGYPKPPKPDCWADSNGCAAGNTIEEAILQGFMELVERDCVALWWYNRIKRPGVNLESFNEPYFLALKDYYQTIHRELWVLDITSDLNIPTFVAITRRIDSEVEDVVLGYGTHLDPKIAILRALTEANQILPAVLSAHADGTTHYLSYDPLAVDWWRTATLQNQPYLVPDERLTQKVCADYPQVWSDDLLEDIMTCRQIVEKSGMEMLLLDQTRPDIGLKVVRVMVPGLRHFWRRLDSGRLYEVPVQLGWQPTQLEEDQLNAFPMWM